MLSCKNKHLFTTSQPKQQLRTISSTATKQDAAFLCNNDSVLAEKAEIQEKPAQSSQLVQ